MNDIQPYRFEPEGTLEEEDDSKWLSNYNPCQSKEGSYDVRAFEFFSFPPSNLASNAAVMVALR